ncbi:MAG: SufD family Fe-S cluster assembly protein [Candidatus Bipolaricaulia bacterium]
MVDEMKHLGEKKRGSRVKEKQERERRQREELTLDYSKFDFKYPEKSVYKTGKGISARVVEEISHLKEESDWMREFRLKAYNVFNQKPMPTWGADLSRIHFDEFTYYLRPTDEQARSWDDVPEEIKQTFDRLGIPEAERKFLAGVGAQYDSEMVYHSIRKDLEKQGVIFLGMDDGLREYPDIVKEYIGTIIPIEDNKFAALNSAVWSGGSFVYVPEGVHVEIPLQAYFRINASNMGQFERTLIIAEPGSKVHYIEGCLPTGEKVCTGERWIGIEAIRPGDVVINGDGEETSVRAVQTRPYRGDLVEIRPLSPGNTFQLTPEHPVLAVKRTEVLAKRKPRNNWLPEVDTQKLLSAEPHYIEAANLEVGDFLVFPVNKVVRDNEEYTEDLLRLLGYYLAEGSAFVNRTLNMPVVSFSFGQHERAYIEEVKELVGRVTGKPIYEVEDHQSGVSLIVYSQDLMERCIAACGKHASDKRLNKEIMELPPEKQAHLLETYFFGDSSVYRQGRTMVRASTASRVLAGQLQELLARQGIYASIMIRKGGEDTLLSRSITRQDQYILYYTPDKKHSQVRYTGDDFLVPIKALNHIPYDGPVFNFAVSGKPNSYLTRGFVVHNCTAPVYTTESLHSAVVEIIAKPGAHVRYTTLQNWSSDVYNLVTKRAVAYQDAQVEWVDANIGCLTADTKVFLNPRGAVSIKDVKPDDRIYALDLNSMRVIKHRVNGVVCTGVKPVFKLITENHREIKATANHPFLTLSRPVFGKMWQLRWKPLETLKPGDYIGIIQGLPDEGIPVEFVRILSIEPLGEEAVYDIEVEDAHNFLANGLVVHNSRVTMKYPSIYMLGKGAKADILSVAYAGKGQHQDAGGKAIHAAPYTTSTITSKSISKDGGRATYRGHLKVAQGAVGSKANVMCDALLLDEHSRSDTYPYIEIDEDRVTVGHEATVGKVGEDQIFYLMSRGLSEAQALSMIVLGFMEPFTKVLPMEYAVEFNRLIQLEMEGSVG